MTERPNPYDLEAIHRHVNGKPSKRTAGLQRLREDTEQYQITIRELQQTIEVYQAKLARSQARSQE